MVVMIRPSHAGGFLTILLSASTLAAPSAWGGSLERVLMPGEVIEDHAKYEDQCERCHARFDKAAQPKLCRACHKEVARDIARKQGLHGRMKGKRECRECHREHRGRAADLAPIDEGTFDHARTDFPLKGGHAKPAVKCESCHKPRVKYRKAPSDCYACHKKDDHHKGVFGRACKACHTEKEWKSSTFDHNRETKFRFKGRHARLACESCHKKAVAKTKPKSACIACHRKDDHHKGKFGRKCATCHTDREWTRVIFNHDRDTKYPLRGKHRSVKCESCHKKHLYKVKLKSTCYACHKKDDPHKGQEGRNCERCHNERAWKKVRFDHDLTRFPLFGTHQKARCGKCHRTKVFPDAPIECLACHTKKDVHKRKFGTQCGLCHDPRQWKLWDFDHDTRTPFKLDGAHGGLHCYVCHRRPMDRKVIINPLCVSCHQEEDVHDGVLGPQCGRCHMTSSFVTLKSGL